MIDQTITKGGSMPTDDEINDWLAAQGMEVPPAIVSAWLDLFDDLQACFDANNYSDSAQKLIILHLLCLYGLSAGNRYISSQSAPSGASRSFKYAQLRDAYRGQLNLLRLVDPNGCVNGLIPPAPAGKNLAIGVATGDCKH